MNTISQGLFPWPLLPVLLLTAGPLAAKTDRLRVTWEGDPARTAVIGWNQVSGDKPAVHFGTEDHGTAPEKYPGTAEATRREQYLGMDNRFATLSGLKPDTAYYFVVRDSEGTSERSWFRTAPAEPASFTFVAGGDTKSDPVQRQVGRRGNRLVAKLRPLFVLFAGDFTSGDGLDPESWKNWLDDWASDTRSEDGRIYPIVPVRGNHEAHPDILYKLFGLSSPENYFAFDVGGKQLRLYALNSQGHITGGGIDKGKLEEQTSWLVDDLKKHRGHRFKLASYHKPFRPHTKSKGENDYLYELWAEPFHEYGMSAAIEGDSHMHKITFPVRPAKGAGSDQGFARDDGAGTVFLGEGSWGAGTRENNDDKSWTLASEQINQIKWVHVHPRRMEIRTVITANEGRVGSASDEAPLVSPANLQLYDAPRYGKVVRLPFQLNSWREENVLFQGMTDLPQPDEVIPFKNVGDERLRLHFFYPPEGASPEGPDPCVVFFFGGGWTGGTPAHFYEQARHLSELGIVAVCPEYRIQSIHGATPFACVRDAKSAMRWLRANAEVLHIRPDMIAAAGGSAGGHLAAATALIEGYDEPGENLSVSARPDALVLFNPVIDTTEGGYGAEKVRAGGVDDPRVLSPLHQVASGVPPTIVFHGTGDQVVPFEGVAQFEQRMHEKSNECVLIPYEGEDHGFFNRGRGKQEHYNSTLRHMEDFLRRHGYIEEKNR